MNFGCRHRLKCLPTLPLIFGGAISAIKMGTVHKPRPDPQPIRNLQTVQDMGTVKETRAYLPKSNKTVDDATPMRPEPTATKSPLDCKAAFRPRRFMTLLAVQLPRKPPTVNMDVMNEKVASDMGTQVDRPLEEEGVVA